MLNNLKTFLDIPKDDATIDEKLKLIISDTTSRLKLLLGGIEPPEEMDHIIRGVAIKRFNRIGSEGLSSHTVEGESQSFIDNDFDEYADEIQSWLDMQKESTRGKVRFL